MKRRAVPFIIVLMSAWAPLFPGVNQIDRAEASGEAVAAGRKMVASLFSNLKEGKTEDIAKWIVSEVGYALDAPTKVKNTSEYKSKLEIVLISPPASAYGKLDGYDQIDEAYLPGSSRYFRLSYISYHEGAPLIWEFRFYVKPNGKVGLNYISWIEKNPFEYLSTNDMLLTHWLK
jgi:hypothetical protein